MEADNKVRSYRGEKIIVFYDPRRCVHAAECLRGLPQVFNVRRRPWVDPNAAAPERIAEVISRCPSGALSFKRIDEKTAEYVQC